MGCQEFPRPDLGGGGIKAPFQFKNEQKLPKMVFIIPNFLVLHFGKIFTRIQSKIPKLKMHEKLHKNVNENLFQFTFYAIFHVFYDRQLKQLYTANFLNVYPFKMAVQF